MHSRAVLQRAGKSFKTMRQESLPMADATAAAFAMGGPVHITRGRQRGFTLIELVMVIVILGVLAAIALPKFVNISGEARTASIRSLEGAVRTASGLINAYMGVRGQGAVVAGSPVGLTFLDYGGTTIRVWNGYPDRWWDGIGMTLANTAAVTGTGYGSTAPIPYGKYTFYGYGNAAIPNGDAGWRLEDAPNPANCSVAYTYNGSGVPVVTATVSGC
jgi:MSHA pilin protein MshA